MEKGLLLGWKMLLEAGCSCSRKACGVPQFEQLRSKKLEPEKMRKL